MDSIERLQECCKDVLRDIREVELQKVNITNEIGSAQSRLNLLQTDVKVLQEKYDNLQTQVKEEKKKELQAIDDRTRDIANLKAQVESELAQVRVKSNQADQLNDELAKTKSDYENKSKELADRDKAISQKLKDIEEFQSRLRI